jgi:Fe-S-cluster formation regulator IscX/YfhJ
MVLSRRDPRVRQLTYQRLLSQPICELGLRPADTLRECLIQLRRELKARHIAFWPHFYFGEEPWGCVDCTGSVEIPFFLANNGLRRVAERYYISYSKKEMLMLLRHETGHALNYAYTLWKRNDWMKLFGNFRKPYRNIYNYDPRSTEYVQHLHQIGNPHYAQKHPDEDFSETFAVWLDPNSKWKWRYRSWSGAMQKLRYIDQLFRKERIAVRRPLRVKYRESTSYAAIDETVAEYFQIEKLIDPRVQEYTQDLKEIFSEMSVRSRRAIRADRFIQNYSAYIEDELVNWIADADRREIRSYLREAQTICALNNFNLHPDRATEKLVELVIVATYHVLARLDHIRS